MRKRRRVCIFSFAVSALLLSGLGRVSADSMFSPQDVYRLQEAQKARQLVDQWKTGRQAGIDALVKRGATADQAREAVDERIFLAELAISSGNVPLMAISPKLDYLEEKITVLSAISNLGHQRFSTFANKHGLSVPDSFYTCVCPPGFWYAPSKDGPCEGRGKAYATIFYSDFDSDPGKWASCALTAAGASKNTLIDDVVDKVRGIRKLYEIDVCAALDPILDKLKQVMDAGTIAPLNNSTLASGNWETTFFDMLSGKPSDGALEVVLGALSDKVADRIGLSDTETPTGLGYLVTHSDQPSETGLNNPYVYYTKVLTTEAQVSQDGQALYLSYEMALAHKIVNAERQLPPEDVFQMAVEVTKGDLPLAMLVAHNLLKEAAYARRNGNRMVIAKIGRALQTKVTEEQRLKERYAESFQRAGGFTRTEFTLDPEAIRSKLRDIRPVYDPHSEDRLGPWYHTFGLLFAGSNPALGGNFAWLGSTLENTTRLLNAGSGRSLGKEAANHCAAKLAAAIRNKVAPPASRTYSDVPFYTTPQK